MKKFALAGALLVLAASAFAAKDKPKLPDTGNPHNWLATSAVTDGGHRLGNPAAPTKLMEFVSYTCPHCGHFFQEADAPMKLLLVQPGKVSVELRHLIRDPVDLTAAVMTECVEPAKFFRTSDMLFARQEEWLSKIEATSPAQQARWFQGPIAQRMQAIASDAGFYQMMEPSGYSRSQIDQCFNDTGKVDAIIKQSHDDAMQFGVNSTPSFVVNGKTLDIHTWDDLQKVLGAPATASATAPDDDSAFDLERTKS